MTILMLDFILRNMMSPTKMMMIMLLVVMMKTMSFQDCLQVRLGTIQHAGCDTSGVDGVAKGELLHFSRGSDKNQYSAHAHPRTALQHASHAHPRIVLPYAQAHSSHLLHMTTISPEKSFAALQLQRQPPLDRKNSISTPHTSALVAALRIDASSTLLSRINTSLESRTLATHHPELESGFRSFEKRQKLEQLSA